MTEKERIVIFKGLDCVAKQVRETWRAEDYPENMRGDFSQFRHALIHIHKAAGKLSAIVDHIEHERTDDEAMEAREEIPKLLADLIRCTVKMAEIKGEDIATAYLARAEELAQRWGHK